MTITNKEADDDMDMEIGMIKCERCGKTVPAPNMTMHQLSVCGGGRRRHEHQEREEQEQEQYRQQPESSSSSSSSSSSYSSSSSAAALTATHSSAGRAEGRTIDNVEGDEDGHEYSRPRSRARYSTRLPTNTVIYDELEEETNGHGGTYQDGGNDKDEIIDLADDDDDDDVIVEEWACPTCTLRNPIDLRYCDACRTRNPHHPSVPYGAYRYGTSDVRLPDVTRRERLIGQPNNAFQNNNGPGNSAMVQHVGGSALLGGAIGAITGLSRERGVLNSALEGAVVGAVGGAISHIASNHQPPPSFSSSRDYLNIYARPTVSLGYTYRIGNRNGGPGHEMPLDAFRMMAAARNSRVTRDNIDNIDNMDYDRLLEVFGDGSENRGASTSTIQNLPTSTIKDVEKELPQECRKCCICLEEFSNGQKRKNLECLHGFHEHCIDRWLKSNASCPICKFELKR